jgi:hypothetical protein
MTTLGMLMILALLWPGASTAAYDGPGESARLLASPAIATVMSATPRSIEVTNPSSLTVATDGSLEV